MHPLGLPDTRLAAVRGIARDFLATDWQDPSEFKHVRQGGRPPAGGDGQQLVSIAGWQQNARRQGWCEWLDRTGVCCA